MLGVNRLGVIALPGATDSEIAQIPDHFGDFVDLRCLPGGIKDIPKNLILAKALPKPRLELRWDRYSRSYATCDYNLVLPVNLNDPRYADTNINFEGNALVYNLDYNETEDVELRQYLSVKENGDLDIYVPPDALREMQSDSFVLKIPAYIVYEKVAIFVEPDAQLPAPKPLPAFGGRKPVQTVVLDISCDVLSFKDVLSIAQLADEFQTALIASLVNECMTMMNARSRVGVVIDKVHKTLNQVLHPDVVNQICHACEHFVDELLYRLNILQIWIPPSYVAPYRFGGFMGNDIFLQYDDKLLKLEEKK